MGSGVTLPLWPPYSIEGLGVEPKYQAIAVESAIPSIERKRVFKLSFAIQISPEFSGSFCESC